MDYFISALTKKYADFSGRARRAEYWWFVLFSALVSFIFTLIATIISKDLGNAVSVLLNLFFLLPSLSLGVRRLHDVNKSGWFLLIVLIPIFGIFYLLYLNLCEGDRSENQYGPSPKN